jgi:hypothetical protein
MRRWLTLGLVWLLASGQAAAAGAAHPLNFSIGPSEAELRLGQALTLQVHQDHCDPGDKNCDFLLPIDGNAKVLRWMVNGVEGGSDATGRIVRNAEGTATYVAPRTVPARNPVAISAVVAGTGRTQVTLVSEVRIVDLKPWSGHLDMRIDTSLAWTAPHGHAYEGWLRYAMRQPVTAVLSESSNDDGTRFVALQLGDPGLLTLDHRLRHQPPKGDPCHVLEYDVVTLRAQPAPAGAGATWTIRVNDQGRVTADFLPQPPLVASGQHDFVVEGCATRTTSQPIAPQLVTFEGLVGRFVGSRLDPTKGSQGRFEVPATVMLYGNAHRVIIVVTWDLRRDF